MERYHCEPTGNRYQLADHYNRRRDVRARIENRVSAAAVNGEPMKRLTEREYLALPTDRRGVWTTERDDWPDWPFRVDA